MTARYVSELAYPETIAALREMGDTIVIVPAAAGSIVSAPVVSAPVADHADLYHCRLGIADNAPVIHALPGDLASGYPAEAAFNAVCTGRFFLHNRKITNRRLLAAAEAAGLTLVHVPQGYARCSAIPVSETAIITYDHGIAKAASAAGLSVLVTSPGHVLLPGYDTGFLGGTSGNLNGEVLLFNGDLSRHPDFQAVTDFVSARGLTCRWIPGKPLRDIGSII